MTHLTIRSARLPEDEPLLRRLDTSYQTDTVVDVSVADDGIRLTPRSLPQRRRQGIDAMSDDLDPASRSWSEGWVALHDEDGVAIGFVAAGFESWNRRARVGHLCVAPTHRRQGVARRLLEVVTAWAAQQGAVHLFVEVPNVNAPAIAAYRQLGFRLVGADASRYDGTAAAGQTAVYLARGLEP